MTESLTTSQRDRCSPVTVIARVAMLVALALFTMGQANAQSAVLSLTSGSTTPGSTVALTMSLTSSGGAQPTSLQWTMSYAADVTDVSVVAGSASTSAGKSVSCSGTPTTCIVFGINTTTISNGAVAIATFTISGGTSSTNVPITVSGVVVSDGNGNSISATGNGGAITVIQSTLVTPTSLSCNPSSVNAPGTSSCTVTLSAAAPGGGLSVALSSNNASATVPGNVTVGSGATTGNFTATVGSIASNQSATLTATANSVSRTTSLSMVAPTPAQLSSVSCSPSSLTTSQSSTCTVTLNKAALSTTSVTLSSNNGVLTVPGSMSIATNASSGTFTATAGTVSSNATATVTATSNAISVNTNVSLVAPSVSPSSLSCNPTSVNAPGSSLCTVSLSGAAPGGGLTVILASNNGNATVPGSVTVSSGATSATFTATVASLASDQTATLTASANSVSRTTNLTMVSPAGLSSVNCSPNALGTAQSATCTVTLNKAALSAAVVGLSSNTGVLAVPGSMTIVANASSGTFTATAGTVSNNATATVSATLNAQTATTSVSLVTAPTPSGLSCNPSSVTGSGTSTCTVTLTSVAPGGGLAVALSSANANATVPPSVTVASGASTAGFNVTVASAGSDQTAVLTATANGVSQNFSLSLLSAAAPAQISAVSCLPGTLGSGQSATCTVTLNKAALATATVTLSSNNALLSLPASITIPISASSGTFTAATGTVSNGATATITATLNAQTATATVSLVAALTPSSLTCTPSSVTGPGTSACTITLTSAAPGGGLVVGLSSGNASATLPSSVTVASGATTAGFNVGVAAVSADQAAVLTASANGASQTFSLGLRTSGAPAQISSVGCLPATAGSGQTATCTVTLTKAATGDANVSLSSDVALLIVPPSMTIGSGVTSATFTATVGTVSSSTVATITATWNGVSVKTTVTLNPKGAELLVTGLVDPATGSASACSPGGWINITGTGFTTSSAETADSRPLPTVLAGTQVMVNDTLADLLFASNSLITFQCPDLAPGSPIKATLQTVTGSATIPIEATVRVAVPRLFTLGAPRPYQGAVMISSTNEVAMVKTAEIPSRPAIRGEYVTIYATGLGAVDENLQLKNSVKVWIGGVPVNPVFAGIAPGSVGLYQVNAQIPLGSPIGSAVPLYVEVLSAGSGIPSNSVEIAVSN